MAEPAVDSTWIPKDRTGRVFCITTDVSFLDQFKSAPMQVNAVPMSYDGTCTVTYRGLDLPVVSEQSRVVSGNLWKQPE